MEHGLEMESAYFGLLSATADMREGLEGLPREAKAHLRRRLKAPGLGDAIHMERVAIVASVRARWGSPSALLELSAADLGAIAARRSGPRRARGRGRGRADLRQRPPGGRRAERGPAGPHEERDPARPPAFTVNQACGSGLQSILLGAERIRLGRARVVLAGGAESMTRFRISSTGRARAIGSGTRRSSTRCTATDFSIRSAGPDGRDRGEAGRHLQDLPRRAGRLRARKPAPRRGRDPGQTILPRDRAGFGPRP